MHIEKRTYSIDQTLLRAFEKAVASGNRSVVINNLLRKYLAQQEVDKIRTALINGAKEMNDLYLEEANSWNPLEEELYGKTSDTSTSPRGHRASAVRSSKGSRTIRRSSRARSLS